MSQLLGGLVWQGREGEGEQGGGRLWIGGGFSYLSERWTGGLGLRGQERRKACKRRVRTRKDLFPLATWGKASKYLGSTDSGSRWSALGTGDKESFICGASNY